MVKIIIERHCLPGAEEEFERRLVKLRGSAMNQPGYVSGETLRSIENPSLYFVISTWSSKEAWQAWRNDTERQEMRESIDVMLSSPERIAILEPVWQS